MKYKEEILRVNDLAVDRGGVRVLDVPFFSLCDGETVGLIGPNGCGKTSLLLALSFLLSFSKGTIFHKGAPVSSKRDITAYRRQCAMIFQEPLLFSQSVYDNIASGLRFRGLCRDKVRTTADEFIELFGLTNLRNRSAVKLSGGEARRTSLARAFATRPDIVFLDEPFSSLDISVREPLIYDFKRILGATGAAAVIVTHNRDEAITLADRLAVMSDGKILAAGATGEILNTPANEFAASFSGMETVLAGTVVGKRKGVITVAVNGTKIEAVSHAGLGEKVALCLRPEDIGITVGRKALHSSVRNAFPAVISAAHRMSLVYKIVLDCGFPLTAHITRGSMEQLNMVPGKKVIASFKATAVHVIRY